MDVDSLARMICTVDGNHDLGAGELAERLLPMITTAIESAPAPGGEATTIASLTAELETLCNVIDGHAVHVAVEAQAAQARFAIAGAAK